MQVYILYINNSTSRLQVSVTIWTCTMKEPVNDLVHNRSTYMYIQFQICPSSTPFFDDIQDHSSSGGVELNRYTVHPGNSH